MSNEQDFLIKYGLHNFVTGSQKRGKRVFVIKGMENQILVSHARHLIEEGFGASASIQVA